MLRAVNSLQFGSARRPVHATGSHGGRIKGVS